MQHRAKATYPSNKSINIPDSIEGTSAHAHCATKVRGLESYSAAGKPHHGTKRLGRVGNGKIIGYPFKNTWT